MSPVFWAAISACAAVAAFFVGFFNSDWWKNRRKPEAAVEVGLDCPLTQTFLPGTGDDWIMVRLRICNEGTAIAKTVEVHLTNVRRVLPGNVFERVARFIPARFAWTHGHEPSKKYIVPETSGLVDLGKLMVVRNTVSFEGAVEERPHPSLGATSFGIPWWRTDFALCTEVDREAQGEHWRYTEPGHYRFDLIVTCTRGVIWRGWIDLSFNRAQQRIHDGRTFIDYSLSIKAGPPQGVGVEVCRCSS